MTEAITHRSDCFSGAADGVAPGSVDLVIADPPYFEVIGEKWDCQWRSEADYTEWSKGWIEKSAEQYSSPVALSHVVTVNEGESRQLNSLVSLHLLSIGRASKKPENMIQG
jgi:hypothetical protein